MAQIPDDLTSLLGAVGRATNPRMSRPMDGRRRGRPWCRSCHERRATHAGYDATSNVTLIEGCQACVTMWVTDPDFLGLVTRTSTPVRNRPHVCTKCGRACTTPGHLAMHARWCPAALARAWGRA